jgi:nucleoside phosphorylase
MELFDQTGAVVCDMESVGVLKAAASFGVPTLVAKAISDTAETGLEGFKLNLEQTIRSLAQQLDRLLHDLNR